MPNHIVKAEPFVAPAGIQLAHLAGEAAHVRQAIAAHFLKNCADIIEIGGAGAPITNALTHAPRSVLVVDPKITAFAAEELRGAPCRVRHVAAKLQQVTFDAAPGTYGLALLGLSLKPFGAKPAVPPELAALCDNARRIVIDYAIHFERSAGQLPALIGRGTLREVLRLDLRLSDPAISATPYAERRLIVLEPVTAR